MKARIRLITRGASCYGIVIHQPIKYKYGNNIYFFRWIGSDDLYLIHSLSKRLKLATRLITE